MAVGTLLVRYGRLAAAVIIFALWELAARLELLSSNILSSASSAIGYLPQLLQDGTFLDGLAATLASFAGGLALAATVGIAVGIWLGLSRVVDRVLNPYMTVLLAAPKVVFLPIFLLIFGLSLESNMFFGAFLSVFPIVIATRSSVSSVKPIFLTIARVMGASSGHIFAKVVLPASLHSVISGLRIGAVTTMTGVVISELFAGSSGLGYLVGYYSSTFQVPNIYATILTITFISIAINEAFLYLEKLTTRWSV